MKVTLKKCSICWNDMPPQYLFKVKGIAGLVCEGCSDELEAQDIGDQLSGWSDEDEERR